MKSERQHREDIVRFGRMLHQRGYVAATDGNLSVRLDHETILSTPTSMSKGMLEPEDLVVVDMRGKRVTGRRNVSSEIGMHLLIYSLRPDAHGIVHAHPPTATGYAAAEGAARGRARRAIVIAPDWVAGALTQALAKQGFTAQTPAGASENAGLAQARAQGTPWVIVVHATTTPGGKVFAQVAATAALDVRALDARSGAVVASAQKQAKGVGRTPEAAQQAAASEAGLGAGNEVAAALVAKENAGL